MHRPIFSKGIPTYIAFTPSSIAQRYWLSGDIGVSTHAIILGNLMNVEGSE